MRHKYIRFFISSTFIDMELERNLLQEVFEKLTKEYSKQGWVIETVDLRWGISNEAGLDNKTMQICKEELTRCQRLSPKPNFVILLGNRYGWIPLPETIPYSYWKTLKHALTKKGVEFFNKWYKFDQNALPYGEYVLQPRKKEKEKDKEIDYREKDIWENYVEKPLGEIFHNCIEMSNKVKKSILSKLFPNNWPFIPDTFYGLSATELEILQGALSVDDAEEHVLAYFRDLTDVCKDFEDFLPNNEDRSIKLKNKLKRKLSENNIYEKKIPFHDYLPPINPKEPFYFRNKFKVEMEKRLRNIIEKVIKSETSATQLSENQVHQRFAENIVNDIIGRKTELSYIDAYIRSTSDNKPKWIKAKSGAGKTVLLSKIAETYKDTHYVICRFCGQTIKSSRADNLISSVTEDLNELNNSIELLGSPADFFQNIHSDKPIILIIDALDQVADTTEANGFSSLDWLFPYKKDNDGKRQDIVFPQNVKIILSSLDGFNCSNEKHIYDILSLGDMGKYSFELAYSRVQSAHRRLTSLQRVDLVQLIDKSDKSALYLHILGTYLAKVTDEEDISTLPTDINGIVNKILDNLEKPERHGAIVKEVLSLLSVERIGFTDKEIITLLAENENFYHHFKDNSHHKWNDHGRTSIPPVLWSRLKYDIKPFLRERISEFGLINMFFHNGIKQVVEQRYFNRNDYKYYYELLYNHYKKTISDKDPHALSELIHCGCLFASYLFKYRDSYDKTCSEIHSYMHNREIIQRKIEKGVNTLRSDVVDVLKYIKGQAKEYLELYQVQNIKMLPTSNIYRKIIDEAGLLPLEMEDLLADHKTDSTLYVVPSLIGTNYYGPISANRSFISNNGEKVMYVAHGQEVIIENLTDPSLSYSYKWNEFIEEIQCSDDMRYHAIRQNDRCFKYDSIEKKVLESYPISKDGWMTLSKKGDLLCEGNQHLDILQAMWTTSGIFIWAIGKDYTLRRYNKGLTDSYYESIIELKDDERGVYNPLKTDNYKICTCSDTMCVLANKNSFILLRYLSEIDTSDFILQKQTNYREIDKSTEIFRISPDENKLYVYYPDGNICIKYHIDQDSGLIKDDDFCSSISCINNNATIFLSNFSIRDLAKEMSSYSSLIQVRVDGVKEIASSNSGSVIGISSRTHWDSHSYMNLIYNNNQIKWHPPFNSMNYSAISAIAISPNGKFIVVSTLNKDQFGIFFIKRDSVRAYEPDFSIVQTVGSCVKIAITDDSNYIVAANGKELFVLSLQGDTIYFHENIKTTSSEGYIQISSNNRYIIINSIIIDNILNTTYHAGWGLNNETLLDGNNYPILLNNPYPNPNVLLCSRGLLSLDSHTINIKEDKDKNKFLSCSRTGRYFFFREGRRFYISKYTKDQYDTFLESVNCVIPAFNEDYVFVTSESESISHYSTGIIYLYNIKERNVVQRCETTQIAYLKLCAKGLIVAQKGGETHLFSPSNHIPVNQPAVTTFVRRWNLGTKVQEEPTAICPMCGGRIDITPDIREILIENPEQPIFEDWDKTELFGHHCPHCNAELRYNPYIY